MEERLNDLERRLARAQRQVRFLSLLALAALVGGVGLLLKPGPAVANHSAHDPEWERHGRSGRMAGRKVEQHGAWEVAKEVRHHRASGRCARRLVAPRQLADDDRTRFREKARLLQLEHHPVQAIRTLTHFVQKQHETLRRPEGEWCAERREHLCQRPAEEQSARLAGGDGFQRPRRQLAHRFASAQSFFEGIAIVAFSPTTEPAV